MLAGSRWCTCGGRRAERAERKRESAGELSSVGMFCCAVSNTPTQLEPILCCEKHEEEKSSSNRLLWKTDRLCVSATAAVPALVEEEEEGRPYPDAGRILEFGELVLCYLRIEVVGLYLCE